MDKNQLKLFYIGSEGIDHLKNMKKTLKTGNLSILLDNLKIEGNTKQFRI